MEPLSHTPAGHAVQRPLAARMASRAAPAMAIALCSAHALRAGWGRWGSLFVDTGRELEWPRRVLEGDVLYADLQYTYGPLAPYINAVWYALFGVRLEVLAVAGAVTAIVAAGTAYLLARRFIGRLGSTVVAVTFLYTCAFAHVESPGFYNWVLPYSFAATYGMLLAMLSLLGLVCHAQQGSIAPLRWSIAALALTAVAKLEPLAPILVAHAVFVAGALALGRPVKRAIAAYIAAALAVVGVYVAFYAKAGPAMWQSLAGISSNREASSFATRMAGLDRVADNAMTMGTSALVLLGLATICACVVLVTRRERTSTLWKVVVTVCGCVAVVAFGMRFPVDLMWCASPALLAGGLVAYAAAWGRRPERRAEILPLLLLLAFALAALPRIVLAAGPPNYGFYLFPPAIICFGVFAFGLVPDGLRLGRWARGSLSAMAAAIFVANALAFFAMSTLNFESKTARVTTARGTLRAVPEEATVVAAVLQFLERTPSDSCLLVIPDSSALYFLSGRAGCDGMISHWPQDLYGRHEPAALLRRWSLAPPDTIVWLDREMGEFSYARFGVTYARDASRWILDHYHPVNDPRGRAVILVPNGR